MKFEAGLYEDHVEESEETTRPGQTAIERKGKRKKAVQGMLHGPMEEEEPSAFPQILKLPRSKSKPKAKNCIRKTDGKASEIEAGHSETFRDGTSDGCHKRHALELPDAESNERKVDVVIDKRLAKGNKIGKRKIGKDNSDEKVRPRIKKKRIAKESCDSIRAFEKSDDVQFDAAQDQTDNASKSGLKPEHDGQQTSLSSCKSISRSTPDSTDQGKKRTESCGHMRRRTMKHVKSETSCKPMQKPSRTSKLLARFHDRLLSGHFRYLNEKLYTGTGAENYKMMNNDKSLFEQYHRMERMTTVYVCYKKQLAYYRDYNQQMKGWPILPVDVAVSWLRKKPKNWRVADFGCGEARLEKSVSQDVSSLDLVALVPGVIECNMANTPLETGSHDCAVFCLALMGVDYPCYIREAYRILKPGGTLWIAEVCSRFVTDGRKEEYKSFNDAMSQLGFQSIHHSWPSKFFVVSIYKKGKPKSSATPNFPALKACTYKKR